MRIFQGDARRLAQRAARDFLFSGLSPERPESAGSRSTFDVNIEGILTMSARDVETGKQMKTTVRVTQH